MLVVIFKSKRSRRIKNENQLLITSNLPRWPLKLIKFTWKFFRQYSAPFGVSGDFTPGGKNRLCNIPLTLLRNANKKTARMQKSSSERALKAESWRHPEAGNGTYTSNWGKMCWWINGEGRRSKNFFYAQVFSICSFIINLHFSHTTHASKRNTAQQWWGTVACEAIPLRECRPEKRKKIIV